MELPLGGPALRHYTQSRPRPHRQKLNYRPSRPQQVVNVKSDHASDCTLLSNCLQGGPSQNIPIEALVKDCVDFVEETIIESENEVLELIGRVDEGVEEFFTKRVLPADTEQKQNEEPESITVDEVVPATSVPCPPQTKTLRRKLGDFFTLRKRRGLKSETAQEGRPKKASIADLIRPLREAAKSDKEKDKDRVREQDKENEKEKGKEQPSGVTGESTAQETPASDVLPLRGEVAPPRRALREGKSQSLILLSGSAAGAANARKKQFEGQHSFEQKLHLMLQRIGVSKAQPEETQNPEREMKKAESEGTIIDSKVEPTPAFTKHRTMSASSDTRRHIRPSMSAHESAGKPALPPKPILKPATSGRNTPENELVQIEEGKTSTPTKEKSPTATPSGPATPAVVSNDTPDLADMTISSSPTATSESDVLAVNTTATIANGTDVDGKPSDPEVQLISTEQCISVSPTAFTEPPALVPQTSSESVTPRSSATSDTPTGTSITILETVSSHLSESETNTSVKPTSSVSNGIVSCGEVTVSVISTVEVSTPASIQPADTKSDLATSSLNIASDDFTASASIGTKRTSVAPSPTPPKSDTSIISSSTLPPASNTSITTTTSTDCTDSSPSIVPSTSFSETNSIVSTTTNNADLTTADAISSPLTTDPLSSKKTSSTLTSVITCLPASEDSSITGYTLTSPALAHDSPRQDLPTNLDERSSSTVKGADVELEVVQKSKQAEETESKKVVAGGKESEHCEEKSAQGSNGATMKEAQEANVKVEDVTVATIEGEAEPAPENEPPNQEETKK